MSNQTPLFNANVPIGAPVPITKQGVGRKSTNTQSLFNIQTPNPIASPKKKIDTSSKVFLIICCTFICISALIFGITDMTRSKTTRERPLVLNIVIIIFGIVSGAAAVWIRSWNYE